MKEARLRALTHILLHFYTSFFPVEMKEARLRALTHFLASQERVTPSSRNERSPVKGIDTDSATSGQHGVFW